MVAGTRLDCTTWATALMRQAVSQAGWHVAHRSAFGATLIDKPLMQNVLADLEIETEAATLLDVRLSGAFERAPADEDEAAIARLGAAVAKYWRSARCEGPRSRRDFDGVDAAQVHRHLLQAPTASNSHGWQWMVIEDAQKNRAIAELYAKNFNWYASRPGREYADGDTCAERQELVRSSESYLAGNFH